LTCFTVFLASVPILVNAFQCKWQALTASFGMGKPDQLKGGRVSYQFLPQRLIWHKLSLYFDISAAYWHVDYHKYKSIAIGAIAPVLRYYVVNKNTVRPYVEVSIGGAYLSKRKLGHRNLGGSLAFQDIFGIGINFGSKGQYDLSLRYLHYSNAGFVPPNNGIDVKLLLTCGYHF
jgi:hypothetical protein